MSQAGVSVDAQVTRTGAEAVAEVDGVDRRLERALQRLQVLEVLVEETERALDRARRERRESVRILEHVMATMDSAVFVTDTSGAIVTTSGCAERMLGYSAGEMQALRITDLLGDELGCVVRPGEEHREVELRRADGTTVPALVATSVMQSETGAVEGSVVVATDLSERKRLEHELRQAQRLESVGQLAAGVAHEINTPIQFIGDSVHFIGDVVTDLLELVDGYAELRAAIAGLPDLAERCDALADLEAGMDLEFAREEAPAAIDRTIQGVRRVSAIVAALKQFAHPGQGDLRAVDLNTVVKNTIVVAANEYKYVADVETDLEHDLPPILGDQGDLGQVVLNMVVNASHAIADRGDGTRGTITLRTSSDDQWVELRISDTGCGIPDHVAERIFDPFFTTKEVGRGTGQGLAISRTIVVERHNGRLEFETEPGVGTTFIISLRRLDASA